MSRTFLHGEPGAFDPRHNEWGAPGVRHHDLLADWERSKLKALPMMLDSRQREVCNKTIAETVAYRGWSLYAVNVRTNHVHIVVGTLEDVAPERIMNDLKKRCTRLMREAGVIQEDRPVWSRHGSTRYLWQLEDLERAAAYVRDFQDQPLNKG